MAGYIWLNKEQTKGMLELLQERYGDVKLSSLQQKIWDDSKFGELLLRHHWLWGKGAQVVEKGGKLKAGFKMGKKL